MDMQEAYDLALRRYFARRRGDWEDADRLQGILQEAGLAVSDTVGGYVVECAAYRIEVEVR